MNDPKTQIPTDTAPEEKQGEPGVVGEIAQAIDQVGTVVEAVLDIGSLLP